MAAPNLQEAFPRASTRAPFFEPVQIRKPVSVLTQGVDLGVGGIGLRSTVEIATGTAVELALFGGRVIFLGTVRWCQPLGSGFRIGVKFSHEDAALIAQVHAIRSAGPGKD
jgi:PilZ domain